MTAPALMPSECLTVRYCRAKRADGEPCKQVVGIDSASGLCVHHDPARAEEAADMRKRGGSHDRPVPTIPTPDRPESLSDIITWHSWIAVTLASGQITKATASGLTYNLQQLRAALVSQDTEREVIELRQLVKKLKKQRGVA